MHSPRLPPDSRKRQRRLLRLLGQTYSLFDVRCGRRYGRRAKSTMRSQEQTECQQNAGVTELLNCTGLNFGSSKPYPPPAMYLLVIMSLSRQDSKGPATGAAMVEESAGARVIKITDGRSLGEAAQQNRPRVIFMSLGGCSPRQEERGEEKCDSASAARRQRLLADQVDGRATSGVACNRVGRQGLYFTLGIGRVHSRCQRSV